MVVLKEAGLRAPRMLRHVQVVPSFTGASGFAHSSAVGTAGALAGVADVFSGKVVSVSAGWVAVGMVGRGLPVGRAAGRVDWALQAAKPPASKARIGSLLGASACEFFHMHRLNVAAQLKAAVS